MTILKPTCMNSMKSFLDNHVVTQSNFESLSVEALGVETSQQICKMSVLFAYSIIDIGLTDGRSIQACASGLCRNTQQILEQNERSS